MLLARLIIWTTELLLTLPVFVRGLVYENFVNEHIEVFIKEFSCQKYMWKIGSHLGK
jgi:hypothetical protein